MKTSEQIGELAAALAKAQIGFETAARDHKAKVQTRSGGSYEFAYADFASYLEVCRKPLGENGLSFIQDARATPTTAEVVTRLMHSSGQWIESEPLSVPLIATSNDGTITAQVVGSGITYAKRYSLSSLIGMASEADDDGNAASGNTAEINRREPLPVCPNCSTNLHVIKGKEEYGGGYVCYQKKGGCGAKWHPEESPKQEPKNDTPPKANDHELSQKDRKIVGECTQMFAEAQSQKEFDGLVDMLNASAPDAALAKADNRDQVRKQIWNAAKTSKFAAKYSKQQAA